MKLKRTIIILAASCMMYSCTTKTESNPFLNEFQTEYGVPAFDKIKLEHYEPAFLKGIEEQNRNIKAIIENSETPTFENTIVALDNSSPILDRVSAVFYNMTDAETTDALTELSIKIAPVLSEHSDNISLNQELFKKVDAVYQQKNSLHLTTEQERLLDKTYKDFVRSGANLPADKQARLREINKELSTLGITFSNNILNENNAFQLFVDKEEDLAGLPEWFCQSAAEEAKAAGQEGKWLFTLHNASRLPFLQYSENRPLREKIYKAYTHRGNNDDKNDNKKVITQIVSLRLEKANLLGFDCYSNFVLENTMAKNSTTVMEFLNNLWNHSLPKAKAEAVELQKLMDKEGKGLIEATLDAVRMRLRPILMTSLAMVIGLLPLMFASGVGANGNSTLGTGAIGGMLIGMICQIFVVPALFVAFQHLQERFKPLHWDDTDNTEIEAEIEQYTK